VVVSQSTFRKKTKFPETKREGHGGKRGCKNTRGDEGVKTRPEFSNRRGEKKGDGRRFQKKRELVVFARKKSCEEGEAFRRRLGEGEKL